MNVYRSDKGFLSAEHEGINIHSRYNPQVEARRFIEKTVKGTPSAIILLGAGLGYIQKELALAYPQSRILSVFHDSTLYGSRIFSDERIICWHPSSGESIGTFFHRHMGETDLPGLQVLEWEPSSRLFPELSMEIGMALKNAVQQLNGNIQTTALFGRKWIRNLISNFLFTDQYCLPDLPRRPVLIASSGPSLNQALPSIIKNREDLLVFALPSSLAALSSARITPDIQISTDPGYYGSMHLSHLFPRVPLANPLTSCSSPGRRHGPVWVLNQNTEFEKDLFSLTEIPHTNVPSNGTVSGTALDLAWQFSSTIYFAGLDLCFTDIISHVRPHTFDALLESDSSRFSPLHSIYYRRAENTVPDFSLGIRTGRSLDTYRNWFSRVGSSRGTDIKRLNPSPVKIDNIEEGHFSHMDNPAGEKEFSTKAVGAPPFDERLKTVGRLISLWEEKISEGSDVELFYFIDTEGYTKGHDRSKALLFLKGLKETYGQECPV